MAVSLRKVNMDNRLMVSTTEGLIYYLDHFSGQHLPAKYSTHVSVVEELF